MRKPKSEDSTSTPSAASRQSAKSPSAQGPAALKRGLKKEAITTRRTAAVILEVLAGVRSSSEAAEALGVSVPRYYLLETRALEGLVVACRPRQKGPPRSAERELHKLREEIARLRRECARSQALLRLAQRAVGVKASPQKAKPAPKDGTKRRRKRRATARALRAAELLRESPAEKALEADVPPREDEGLSES